MRVIGLMSGTSIDGIDAALVELQGADFDLRMELLATATLAYPQDLQATIADLADGGSMNLEQIYELDDQIALAFAEAAIAVQAGHSPADLIGSHGQTVYHRPPRSNPSALGYSLQLGRGATIAHRCQIPTVSNFRAADIAVGGQGAPLVPRVDACLLGHPSQTTCVQNLGGIGNVTYLPAQSPSDNLEINPDHFGAGVRGWDTGPANVLIDLAMQIFTQGQQRYDRDGDWAAAGTVCEVLLDRWLSDPFYAQKPPKSTGREYFGVSLIQEYLEAARMLNLTPQDTIATLTELTAISIVDSYRRFLPTLPDRVLLCGGGSHNGHLRRRIQAHLEPSSTVQTTDDVGLNADSKEAIAFAVLAYWRWHNQPGNLPSVTGASRAVPLGDLVEGWGGVAIQ